MKKILGIDMGTKRIGLALSNIEETFAFPFSVIEGEKDLQQIAQIVLPKIVEVAQAEGVETVVIGESKDFAQNHNPIMKQIAGIQHGLEQAGFTVILEPEFLSSAQAERFQGKHDKLDASAATIILQSYLDRKASAR
jgi:putative Holliday junction resolvase